MYVNITEKLRLRNVTKGAPGPVRWQDWNPVCRRKALALTTPLYFLLSPPDSAFPPHLSPLLPSLVTCGSVSLCSSGWNTMFLLELLFLSQFLFDLYPSSSSHFWPCSPSPTSLGPTLPGRLILRSKWSLGFPPHQQLLPDHWPLPRAVAFA